MKYLRWIGLSILLAILLLVGGIAWLTLTEAGSQWLFTQAAHLAPGELRARQVEGRLGEALTLTGLRYHTPDFTLEIRRLEFAWRPAALLDATLWIERLHLREVTWEQRKQQESSTSEEEMTLPEIQLPLKVRVDSLQIQGISLQRPRSPPVVVKAVAFKGNFDGQSLAVTELEISAPQGQLRVNGRIALQKAYPLEFVIQWAAPIPDLGEVAGAGRIVGDLQQLTLRQEVQTPFQLQFRGRLSDLLEQPRWVAILEVPETNLRQVSSQWPALSLGLKLKGAGGLDQFKVLGSYQIEGPQWGKLKGQLSGEQIAMGHWVLHQFNLEQVQGPGRLALHGEAALAEGQPELSFQGQWQDLAWPLTGKADFSSEKGRVSLSGSPENYRLKVKTALAGQAIPASEWHLAGTGDTGQFQLEALRGHLLDGTLTAAGSILWKPALAWKLQLEGQSLNPAKQWPQWPGDLTFSAVTNGTLEDGRQIIQVAIQSLSGSLRGYPVAARGQAQLKDAVWRIAELKFHVGDSRLSMEGSVGKQLTLGWRLVSPDLSQVLPAARGKLMAEGYLRGPLTLPAVTLHLQGEGLAYQDFQVASVAADIDLDLRGKRSSRLLIKATDLALAAQVIHSLTIQGSGTPRQHELSLSVEAPERSLSLAVGGSWKEPVWQGEIRKAQLTDPLAGHWKMPRPTSLALSPSNIDLAPWCWQQQAARLCLEGSWQQGGMWHTGFDIRNFSLAMLAPLLPEQTALKGMLEGKARIQGDAHQLARASLQLHASAGRLSLVTPEGQKLNFPYQGVQTKLYLGEEGGEGSFQLLLPESDVALVSVSLRLPPAPLDLTALEQLPLDGQVAIAFDDFSLLAPLLPELRTLQGQLRADLELGGRIAAPRILGEVAFQKGSVQIPTLGLKLTEIWLRADAGKADRVAFKGGVRSGQGQLAFNGKARLDPAADWTASLTIAGERFRAMGTAGVKVLISPQLHITAAKEGVHVKGEVVIPKATLTLQDIERRGGVPVSKDVVIISRKKEAEAKAMPVHARVRITLGDKVMVQGFGFKGRIAGSLLVMENPGKVTTGSGELRIAEGQYEAYGVELDIREGRVVFAGPIDSPQLYLEAVREIDDDVVVGVRAQGSASAPVLTLFSEPAMNESNILAYLILGRPLSATSGDDGELLAKAATSLGLAGGNLLAKRIGKIFGLEEIKIEAEGSEAESAALTMGKYISPRLYVGYGIGLFERFNAFRMRYTLSEHWSLQAETGLESGADLFYNLER